MFVSQRYRDHIKQTVKGKGCADGSSSGADPGFSEGGGGEDKPILFVGSGYASPEHFLN